MHFDFAAYTCLCLDWNVLGGRVRGAGTGDDVTGNLLRRQWGHDMTTAFGERRGGFRARAQHTCWFLHSFASSVIFHLCSDSSLNHLEIFWIKTVRDMNRKRTKTCSTHYIHLLQYALLGLCLIWPLFENWKVLLIFIYFNNHYTFTRGPRSSCVCIYSWIVSLNEAGVFFEADVGDCREYDHRIYIHNLAISFIRL